MLDEIAQQAAAVVHNALLFEQTQEQAFKDGLTGLANPRALQFQVARELGRALRPARTSRWCSWNLDDFKTINDEQGHLAGDRALAGSRQGTAADTTRPTDVQSLRRRRIRRAAGRVRPRGSGEQRRRGFQEAVDGIELRVETAAKYDLQCISAGASVFP